MVWLELERKNHEAGPVSAMGASLDNEPGSRQCELADPSAVGDLRRFTTAATADGLAERIGAVMKRGLQPPV